MDTSYGTSCTQLSSLSWMCRVKHEGYKFSCHQCDYTTVKPGSLRDHVKVRSAYYTDFLFSPIHYFVGKFPLCVPSPALIFPSPSFLPSIPYYTNCFLLSTFLWTDFSFPYVSSIPCFLPLPLYVSYIQVYN